MLSPPTLGKPLVISEDKGYQSTDVDEHGRLRPRPKKRPAVLLPAEECELPHDATLEILAGDLVLKSVNGRVFLWR